MATLCHATKTNCINKFFKGYPLDTSFKPYCLDKELGASSIRKLNF